MAFVKIRTNGTTLTRRKRRNRLTMRLPRPCSCLPSHQSVRILIKTSGISGSHHIETPVPQLPPPVYGQPPPAYGQPPQRPPSQHKYCTTPGATTRFPQPPHKGPNGMSFKIGVPMLVLVGRFALAFRNDVSTVWRLMFETHANINQLVRKVPFGRSSILFPL